MNNENKSLEGNYSILSNIEKLWNDDIRQILQRRINLVAKYINVHTSSDCVLGLSVVEEIISKENIP